MALRKNLDKSNWSLILRDQTVEREGKRKREKKRKKKRREEEREIKKKRYGYMTLVWILHGKQGSYGFVWISRDFYEPQT